VSRIQSFPQASIFAHLDQDQINDLIGTAQLRHYQAGEWIAHYGDIWPFFFFINCGEVTAVKESFEGRSLILTTFCAGEVFWGLAFFIQEAPMPAALHVVQDTELLLWSRESLLPYFLKNGRLSWELSCLMIQKVQLASEIVEKLAFQPVASRLANLLLDVAGDATNKSIARNLTLDEMAARLGTTREVVCRFLHRLSDQRLIEITRTEFSVTDRKGLEDLAKRFKG
jgi:CRP/FNR family transcriptional regulator, dissimilatory nitrate respiration regulator